MSRSGYSEDCDGWQLIMWRGRVTSAIRGKRGQAFLREMLAALDAMPTKRLVANELEQDGEVCALGCVGKARGFDQSKINVEDRGAVAEAFGIAHAMACEIMYENDADFSYSDKESPEHRWTRVRKWVTEQIRDPSPRS